MTQTLSLGIERIKPMLFPLMVRILEEDGLRISGIFERNDVKLRELEGMEQGKGWFPLAGKEFPSETWTEIEENGIRYLVDFENGQKTGFFLDQKYNRRQPPGWHPEGMCWTVFTHTGSFGLNCAKAGAKHVCSVDVSESAIACAAEKRTAQRPLKRCGI